jgi:hypothetical protein
MLGLLALSTGLRADVVLAPGTYSSGINTNTTDFSSGFTFTTTGSSAGSGRSRLTNLAFGLTANSASVNISGFEVFLYKANGLNWNYVAGGTQSNTTSAPVSFGANTVFTLGFNENAAFGQAGVENSGLEAGATYLLGINVLGPDSEAAKIYFSGSTAAAQGPVVNWGPAGSVFNTAASGFGAANITSGINTWGTGENMYVQLDAVAVPEPGTLILGGIAAVSGGAGAWWRRRKNKKATAEQAV